MAIPVQAWPFEDQDTTEAQYGRLAHLWQDDGIADSPTSTAALVTAGSGMTVNVAAFTLAYLAGVAAALVNTGSLTLDPASSTSRIDRIVLRVDSGTNTATVDRVTGTPGATVPPGLNQTPGATYEISLARITVPAGALNITAANIVDERQFTSRRVLQYTTSSRPAGSKGDYGFNHTTGLPEYHNGDQWVSAATTNASALTGGTLPNARLDYGVVNAYRGDRSVDAPVNNDGINGDWNAVLQPGVYRIFAGNSNANAPGGVYMFGTLVVFGAGAGIASRTQIYFAHGSGGMWSRTAWNGNDWTDWQGIVRSTDQQNLQAQIDNRYTKSEIDGGFQARDSSISAANSNANARVYNQQNATRMAAGNALVSNFAKNSDGNYSGYVDVTWPGMALVACTATARSGDSRGVNASVTQQTNSGARLVVTRPNNTATGVDWIAVGN